MHPGKRWKNARQSAEKPTPAYCEDMGYYFDTGAYDPRAGHPGYWAIVTDEGLQKSIEDARNMGAL